MSESKARWICRYCVAIRGLRGADLDQWPLNGDDEGIARHVESVHHIPVTRAGETEAETMERFRREQPEAGGPKCRCPECNPDPRYLLADVVAAAAVVPAMMEGDSARVPEDRNAV